MDKFLNSATLSDVLSDAERAAAKPSLDGVQKSVSTIMKNWPSDQGLYVQLKRLAAFIEQTKSEIAALRPDEVKASFIPTATDELDAIVAATAEATTRIMDAGDVLMELSSALAPAEAERLVGAVTTIYEACSFQDITGQRITKVVKTLKVIEGRIDDMLGSASDAVLEELPPAAQSPSDEDLLNGPALPGEGRTQAEIDALLGFC
jgi:chemotaxis protein CheZ